MRRVLLLLSLVASAAFAQGNLEVISLRHRTAEQVIPVLRPLLEPGGALSGQFNQLIVRTSADNLAQIRAALEAIDRPARRLVISVRFDDARTSRTEQVDQRVQVLEGGRAMISNGESRPLRQRQVVRTPGGAVVTDTTEVQDTATGFEVVPRVSGASVFLEIAPQREQFAPGNAGAIRSERAASTVSGRLGEWFELGGASRASAGARSGTFSASERTAIDERRIWVKVEEAGH
jgi:type II secretory pathway component GspD/PulD (secretin)